MKLTSKTGLISAPSIIVDAHKKQQEVQLRAFAKPAPMTEKSYSGLFNPYPGECSFLCNHPIGSQAKMLLKQMKTHLINGNSRKQFMNVKGYKIKTRHQNEITIDVHDESSYSMNQIDNVPEELFRRRNRYFADGSRKKYLQCRYTDTDSRPATPVRILSTPSTRASHPRRCVTPEAGRPRLVLDLRRTQSQETISISVSHYNLSLIHVHQEPNTLAAFDGAISHSITLSSRQTRPVTPFKRPRSAIGNIRREPVVLSKTDESSPDKQEAKPTDCVSNDKSDEEIRRRGKKPKKKNKNASKTPVLDTCRDPETQMATIGTNSWNHSADPLMEPLHSRAESARKPSAKSDPDSHNNTCAERGIFGQFRGEINEELVDCELDFKRRLALEEILKTVPQNKDCCMELIKLQEELAPPAINSDLWISLPRSFNRSSVRFELPMNGKSLSGMTPLDYVANHLSISSKRKLLYNCIFNKFKLETDTNITYERKISGKVLQQALDLLMGRPMTSEQSSHFQRLIGWQNDDIFDFRTFCGVAAVCERIMAPLFSHRYLDRKSDPPDEVELADFKTLERKIDGHRIDERLHSILIAIKYS
ncbi:uncharacterized protein LOC132699689 [Cylas formicarius]|uniref:uncharacterized protein LOC132699689 n=1 Tax=Cylas formicarius TaxID=197179 RepID=UPI0029589DB2|nr:uncharacterized protein LOC132699689 [Cylas formicarius]